MMRIPLLCLALTACAGCPVRPDPIPPVPDAEITSTDAATEACPLPDADASPAPASPACAAMCTHLRALACVEGNAQCEATCDHLLDAALTDLRTACVISAQTKAAVRACGGTWKAACQ